MFKLLNETLRRQWATAAAPPNNRIRLHGSRVGLAKLSRGPDGFAKLLHQIGGPRCRKRRPGCPRSSRSSAAWRSSQVRLSRVVSAVPLIVMMFVAMFTVHLRYGFGAPSTTIGLTADGPLFGPPGIEVNLLYIAGLLVGKDPGRAQAPLSIDRLLARRRRREEPAASPHPDRLHPALLRAPVRHTFQELPVARWRPGSVHTLPHFVRI